VKKTSDDSLGVTTIEIPARLTDWIGSRLITLGFELNDSKKLAEKIKQLSDFYIENPNAATPESEVASLVYYFPLNYLRNQKIFQEAQNLGFLEGLDTFLDFGAGLGPSSWALQSLSPETSSPFKNHHWVEQQKSGKIYAELFEKEFGTSVQRHERFQNFSTHSMNAQKSLGVFSYSLTELAQFPPWAESLEALMIVEPSTQEDGRRLQELRSTLIAKGFSIWGPCIHEKPCPLLTHSKKDWCHDRLLLRRPPWLEKIESHLPWENKSLTMSYLLARKKSPPWKNKTSSHQARVIGDTLFEKGKTRQLICKDDERVFMAWLHKTHSEIPSVARGSLIRWPNEELKSNEIRAQGKIEYIPRPNSK